MKSVVVTGSSTGIGWGISKVLVSKGFRVFGSVRKAADGERLVKEFGPNFVPVLFDVTDEAAVARGADQVAAALRGAEFVTPDDVKEVAVQVIAHRLVLSPEALLEGESDMDVVRGLLAETPVPR